jgi:hypothetical protein
MKSLWDADARRELHHRLKQLDGDCRRRRGRMTCEQMLAHVTDGLRMATGELPVKPKPGPLKRWPLKQLVIYWLPWPKGAPTAPELLAREPEELEREKAALSALIERAAEQRAKTGGVEHPAFGRLSEKDWGALMYRHIDHHLKQFGL